MVGRDRREDAGQYYPGGRVVPKTPTGQGGGGTSDYDQLANKPKINNHELTGNKTAAQLGLATPSDIPDVSGKLPMRALPPYLHFLAFDDTYPADAAWLYAQLGPSDMGRCSAVRRGGKLWRNYDWTFDDAAEFVVKMSGNATRFASVCVASVGSRLTENDVMSAVNSRYYKCLPGMTLDGINEKGVVCEINVDGGPKTGWHGTGANALHILAAVRWVLDHGETAEQAAEHLAENIIQPQGEMNFHFMVADATSTYIVENGEAHDVTDGTKVLTNYAIYDEAHEGGGKERYTLLAGGADISAVNFTNAYQQGNDWDSDFESREQHLDAIDQWFEQGETRESHRGKTTSSGKAWWQSVHTTEYDFAAKTMKVAVQEVDDWYTFAVDQVNVDLGPIEEQIAALQDGKRDKTDLNVYNEQFSPWTWHGDSFVVAALQRNGVQLYYDHGSGGLWDGRPADFDDEVTGFNFTTGARGGEIKEPEDTLTVSNFDWRYTDADGVQHVVYLNATRTKSAGSEVIDHLATEGGVAAAIAAHHDSTKQDRITASGVLKGDGAGGVTQAEKSSTSQDPANADYRDPQDNTCHKTEFTEWTFSDSVDRTLYCNKSKLSEDYVWNDSDPNWDESYPPGNWYCGASKTDDTKEITMYYQGPQTKPTITATRSAVTTDGKKFVTEDVAAKQSDIPILAAPSESSTDAQAAKARATYDFVNSSINAMAAFYITKNAAGDSFATKAELTAAIASGTFYNGGQPRVPTKNDYLYILADESHPTAAGTSPTTRYSFDGTQWSFQIVVNDTALTAAQLAAMNSGINAALVTWLTAFRGTDTATTLASVLAKLAHLESDGTADDTFATDLIGKPVAKAALMIPLEEKTDSFTAEDGHAYAVTMTGTVTITMPTTTEGKAAIFQARFSAAAQQSVQFDTDDVVKFDGTDCGIVKAGKDALLSAMWNGEAWDLVWKNEA